MDPPSIVNMDFDQFFPLAYNQQREIQRLVAFLTDWVETQCLYSINLAQSNATVNPAELGLPIATTAGDDYQIIVSDLQIMPVSQTPTYSTKIS